MPYPGAHRVVTWFGDAWSQQEIWQFSLRLATGDSTAAPTTAQLDSLITAYQPFHGSVYISNFTRFLGVKVAAQDVNGKYPPGHNSVERLRATPLAGGSNASSTGIPQVTCCVSLSTSKSRGAGSKGRFYPPPTGMQPLTDGRISVDNATAFAGLAKTFLTAVNNSGLGTVSVLSTVGDGSALPASGVRVGRVLDTQRRRRNSLTEEYVSVPLS